jgi:hypothetical protein
MMRIIQGLLLALIVAICAVPEQANAQASVAMWCWNPSGSSANNNQYLPCNASNPLVVSASVTATANVAGFHPESSLTPITATTGGVSSSAFTAGKSVLVQNVGTTNAAYCFPGNSATTSAEYIPAGGSAVITTTSETVITCATSTSTTTINFQVGTGLWSGAGAGSGGGGGGAVTLASGAVASGAYSAGSIAAGAYVSGSILSGALASGAVVDITNMSGTTAGAVPAKATYMGVNVGGNIVGFAPGTAGTASSQVTTVQGIASMTPILSNPGTAANWGVGATGAAVPANAVYLGITSGGNLTGWNGAVTNAGTFAVQATLQGSATTAIGKVDPNTIATWGLAAASQNVAAPTNGLLGLCQFTTAPATITTTNVSPIQCDNANNIKVNVVTATGLAAASTTSGQTGSLIMGAVTTAAPAYTTAQTNYISLTTAGAERMDLNSVVGTTLGAPSNYGTSPGAVSVIGVNSFMTSGNLTQFGGTNLSTGTGAGGAGIPRVTVSNDSSLAVFGPTAVGSANANPPVVIGGTTTGAAGQNVQGMSIVAASTAPVTATNTAVVVDLRPDSPGIITLGPAADTSSVPEVLSPTSSSTSALSHASVTALGNSLVVKASAGNLYAFNCSAIAGAAAGNCIAYNGTAAPGTGALTGANVLDSCNFDTTTKGCSLSRIPMGVNYSTGIVILVSSAASPFTYTTGTDTAFISADYK